MTGQNTTRHKVAIIGAGFGGIAAARAFRGAPVDVEIIDRRNYHLFQPLLYQVATADLSPADIAWPIRGIFSSQRNVKVTMSEVQTIDLDDQIVHCADKDVPFDDLIIATGSQHSYFGKDAWAPHAPGLKKVVDATEVRRRILSAFERAEVTSDPDEQARNLTFVVVGAGPTGVEMAGAIAELAHFTLARDFRNIRPVDAKIILVEAGPRILAAFPDDLSQKALKSLDKLGVDVSLDTMVKDISDDGVTTANGFIEARTVVWAAGVQVRHMQDWLQAETDRVGRVIVEPDLSVPGHRNVYVIGDAAKVPWKEGLDVPGIAPAAKQAGKYVAKRIRAQISGAKPSADFKYRHFGNLATIGRNAAVIDFGWMKLSGSAAWWIWGFAHIYFLIGVRQPILVAVNWLWSYLTYTRGARLITNPLKAALPQSEAQITNAAKPEKVGS